MRRWSQFIGNLRVPGGDTGAFIFARYFLQETNMCSSDRLRWDNYFCNEDQAACSIWVATDRQFEDAWWVTGLAHYSLS